MQNLSESEINKLKILNGELEEIKNNQEKQLN